MGIIHKFFLFESIGEYTGDYNELVYLRARYYLPSMGRFLTRDRWPGDAVSPMSFNHWVYGYSNPIRFIDPSGYISCENSNNPICIERANQLRNYGENAIKVQVQNGDLLPVEGFARFADHAMSLFDNDIRGAMWGMTITIDGMDANKASVWAQATGFLGQQGGNYWLGLDWLPYEHIEENNLYYWDGAHEKSIWLHSRRGDWRKEYWDGTANQAFHFWFYVAVTFFDDLQIARFANYYHEGTPYTDVDFVTDRNAPAVSGNTQADWDLAGAGMNLGQLLKTDYLIYNYTHLGFCNPTTYPNLFNHLYIKPGAWIRANLKDPSFNSRGGR